MDSFAQHVVDPVGAGDALIAYSTLAMLSTSNPIIASIIGNIAAGCECEHDGNIPIGIGEVKNKLSSIQKNIESNT
jgi:bifunctional ADP-heptose synthase (sugar kinase/adenylyltransferase)